MVVGVASPASSSDSLLTVDDTADAVLAYMSNIFKRFSNFIGPSSYERNIFNNSKNQTLKGPTSQRDRPESVIFGKNIVSSYLSIDFKIFILSLYFLK